MITTDKKYDLCGLVVAIVSFIIAAACLVITFTAHTNCNGGKYTKQDCYSFEEVLSHEIGHALGLGHPDGYYDLLDEYVVSYWGRVPDMEYVEIDAMNPCENIAMRKGLHVCPSVSTPSACLKVPECIFDKHKCKSIHHQALMLSTGRPYYGEHKNYVTEDDLAGLFFLYPSPERKDTWGLDVLPLREFSYIKLLALAEDYFHGQCSSIDNKNDILECVYEHQSLHLVEDLKKMADSICRQNRFEECTDMIKLLTAVHNTIQLIRQGRALNFINGEDVPQSNETSTFAKAFIQTAEEALHSLIGEQLTVENSLHDNPNYYSSYAELDSIIDLVLHRHDGDGDDDGVHDRDKDNDGLPDGIESGLNVMQQLLEDIRDGKYKGNWDADGDGIENGLDNVDDRIASSIETCTNNSDKSTCTNA